VYLHEWASFSTKDFPENSKAKSGDIVRIVVTALEDRRPVEDVLWTDDAYQQVYSQSGLESVALYQPLGRLEEAIEWVSETSIAPWSIYVLQRKPDLS